MDLREFAEQVLWSPDITTGKLCTTGVLTDHRPGSAIEAPAEPARPRSLRFAQTSRPTMRLATPAALECRTAQGRLLHAFANHELLALELMALALLRFPQAPRQWRLGLAATMRDEQRHLRRYVERMETCGVALGDAPASGFFWRCIVDAESPLDFAVRMGLILEQANLDFALHHWRLFEELGDHETAAVLKEVYDDEIRHLRHGLHWFERLRPGHADAWTEFQEHIKPPLSPARGRGPLFDEAGRRAAGMDEAFIAEMKVFRRSKGRKPDVYIFQPDCEEAATRPQHHRSPAPIQTMTRDLAWLVALAASDDDVVLVPETPSTSFRAGWIDSGLPLPEAVVLNEDGRAPDLERRGCGRLRPWGATPSMAHRLRHLGTLRVPDPEVFQKTCLPPLRAALRERLGNTNWLTSADTDGCIAHSVGEAIRQTRDLLQRHSTVVWKAPFSSSGRHRRRVSSEEPDEESQRWLAKHLASRNQILIEPWLVRVVDLSFHFDLDASARARGWTRFTTTPLGQWQSSQIETPLLGVPPDVARLLTGNGAERHRLRRVGEALMETLAPWLGEHGHRGPVGVDIMIVEEDGQPRVHPLVEINPRLTMGRLALELRSRLSRTSHGHLRLMNVRETHPVSVGDHATRWADSAPLELDPHGRWKHGRIVLTDPAQAQAWVAVGEVFQRS